MDKDTYYFVHLNTAFNDGGLSRSSAFYEYYQTIGAKSTNVFCKNKFKRALILVSVIKVLFFSRNKKIFIHQGTILYLFPKVLLRFSIFFNILFALLQRTSSRNKLIVEVNDLPYEQAIDLELPIDELDKKIEQALYTIKGCYYIFASDQMNNYVSEKFGIGDCHSETVINGATKLESVNTDLSDLYKHIAHYKYICGYAGTLNKGRQIEDLVELYRGISHIALILLGEWGEWLLEYQLPPNVIYSGNKENSIAQQIISKCDFGIIQYNAERFYYNLCFPTKISFYLAAGIPVLTTPLTELMNHFKHSNSVYFVDFDKWKAFLLSVDDDLIDTAKRSAKIEGIHYEWQSILSSSKFLNS